MRLFHQLSEDDQHYCIHYCMHIVIEDMLEDGVEIEPFSTEDEKARNILDKVIKEAEALPEEERFEFIAYHKEAGQLVFDIALDLARSAYYHPDEDLVIHYESLRPDEQNENMEDEDMEEIVSTVEELTGEPAPIKKNNHNLN